MRWFLLFLLLIPTVTAAEGSIPLLAVSERPDGLYGQVAELSLEIREGKGRVFLETHPVTKVDTQISMRFAQQIACRAAQIDCAGYDFIYTLRARSGIVGGPSAGAPGAVLTYALLTGQRVPTVGITGTINSGGLIGRVGGLKEKIEAAVAHNLTQVYLPPGTRYVTDDVRMLDLVKYGAAQDVVVEEVATLYDLLERISLDVPPHEVATIDGDYAEHMQAIADDLCTRAERLQARFSAERSAVLDNSSLELENETRGLLARSTDAMEDEDYYSAASFCFRVGVNYGTLLYRAQNLSQEDLHARAQLLEQGVSRFRQVVEDKPLDSIASLQSSIIVLDRLAEAEEYVELLGEDAPQVPFWLSFATERLHSARAWSSFYRMKGATYTVDEASLARGCHDKIQEAQERYQYVQFYLPDTLHGVQEHIQEARSYQQEERYAMCLFTAAQAKAESNVVVGVIGASSDALADILSYKLDAAERVIATSQANGFFPIIGYSYYQYAASLQGHDPRNALLFAEYALELSNLDLYFPPEQGWHIPRIWWYYVSGVLSGLVLVAVWRKL